MAIFWSDGNSAIPATYEEWENAVKRTTDSEYLESEVAFYAMLDFLRYFKDKVDYDLQWLIDEVMQDSHNSLKWAKCVAEVSKTDI